MDVEQYETEDGASPFAEWFDDLDAQAAAKVTTALTRLGLGNTSNVKGVGSGVFELKIDFGPGFRSRLPRVFRQGRADHRRPSWRRPEEAAAARHRGRASVLAGLQTT